MTHNQKPNKKVMVFGVFDRLHPGHISFLEQAAQLGDELVVAVARDSVVLRLKNKIPHQDEETRRRAIAQLATVTDALLGDSILGSYEIFNIHQPDIICLGYDQHWLLQDLQDRMAHGGIAPIKLIMMRPHESARFHTSLLTANE